jgi:hypothetical protein
MVTRSPRKSINPVELAKKLRSSGGFSASSTGRTPTDGTMVSRVDTERVVAGMASSTDIDDYLKTYGNQLHRERHVGGWHEESSDSTFLDLSDRWTDPLGAKNAAVANEQISRQDLAANKTINTTEPTLFPLEKNVDPPRKLYRNKEKEIYRTAEQGKVEITKRKDKEKRIAANAPTPLF